MVGLRASQEKRITEEKEKEKEMPLDVPITELVVEPDSWNVDDIRCIYTFTGHDRGM